MGNHNSHVEILLGLYRKMIYDLYEYTLPFVPDTLPVINQSREAERDFLYVEKRVRTEGIKFMTVMLPSLGKHLDCILGGKDDPIPRGFKPYSESGYPLLFRYIWTIICTHHGVCDGPVSSALGKLIRSFRTVLFAVYKLDLPFSAEQEAARYREFLSTEIEVQSFELPSENSVSEYARHVIDLVLSSPEKRVRGRKTSYSFSVNMEEFYPKHGPGAVATGERDEGKWKFSTFYRSVNQRFPFYDFVIGIRSNGDTITTRHLLSFIQERRLKWEEYPVAKLVFVPKDSRGPRLISSEPLVLQFLQQGVARQLVRFVEQDSVCRGHINFSNQECNRAIALESSWTGEFATLDLQEASDRVSCKLVEAMFGNDQQSLLLKQLLALRSHSTCYNGTEIPLKKYAPMGSALCFPVESIIFYALSVAAIWEDCGQLDVARRCVYVYGDDIIVPSKYKHIVARALSTHGLQVNEKKSFWAGRFRESCGMDAWHGHEVTPVRIRKLPGRRPSDGSAHKGWTAYAAHFHSLGMMRSFMYCKEVVEAVIRDRIPITSADFGYLSIVIPSSGNDIQEYRSVRRDAESCHSTALVWVLSNKYRPLAFDSWERLQRSLLENMQDTNPSEVVVKDATLMRKRRKALLWS